MTFDGRENSRRWATRERREPGVSASRQGWAHVIGRRGRIIRCFRCWGLGHRAEDCRDPVRCRDCGTCGHRSFSYPGRNMKGRTGGLEPKRSGDCTQGERKHVQWRTQGEHKRSEAEGGTFQGRGYVQRKESFVQQLNHTLVCSGPFIGEGEIQEWIRRRWKTRVHWRIQRLYGGDFLVSFPNNQWREEMLQEGENGQISWRPWNRGIGTWPGKRGEQKWVELIGIPLDLWNENTMQEVVGQFGRLTEIHEDTRKGIFLEAAKVRVELRENGEVPERVKLECGAESYWIGIHEVRFKKTKRSWVEVVRRETPKLQAEGSQQRAQEFMPELEQEKESYSTEEGGETVTGCQYNSETLQQDTSDPFGLWDILGGKPRRNGRLWEKMEKVVVEEMQGLVLNEPLGERNESSQEMNEGEVPMASEEFMNQLRETEGGEAEEQLELYTPTHPGKAWEGDVWSRDSGEERPRGAFESEQQVKEVAYILGSKNGHNRQG